MSSTSRNSRVFALCDANSFYASCEQVFRPELVGKPVVVLSNNDGCIIAQTKEAKELLDIYMCKAWFEVSEEAKQKNVAFFSSNYELYANMSNRFMTTLRQFAPKQEVYSIDESFLELTGFTRDLTAYGQLIKNTVKQDTGLPICVGFGHSKTLAKLANHCAKKTPGMNGVCDLTSMSEAELNAILEKLPVSKVWGVGNKIEAKLNGLGVGNVLRLKRADCKRIRDEFGVVLERTVKELNGEVWLDLEEGLPEAKQVMSSRSFGVRVDNIMDMQEAISMHAANASQRLRKKGLYASAVYAFIMNSPYDQAEYYSASLAVGLPSPTDSSFHIANAALWLLKQIWKDGVYYQKAGVMLMDLVPAGGLQQDIFGYSDDEGKTSNLMAALDRVNTKYGRGTMKLGSEGVSNGWTMKREFKSPNYTGDWKELRKVL